MKKTLALSLLICTTFTFAAGDIEVNESDANAVIKELDKNEEKAKDPRAKRMLKKVGDLFKDFSKSNFVKKTGRGLGKATTFVTTETLRPFVGMTSWVRGAATKLDDADAQTKKEIFQFYLDNEKELNQLYKDPSHYTQLVENGEASESILEDYKILVENMMKQKALETVKDVLTDMEFDISVTMEDGTVKNLLEASTLEELAEMLYQVDLDDEVDFDKFNNETVHKNMKCNSLGVLAEHVDISPLVDSISDAIVCDDTPDLTEAINPDFIARLQDFINGFIEMEDGKFWKNKKIVDEMAEGVTALVAQYAVPSIVLGAMVPGAGTVYAGVTAISTAGAAISTAVCTNKKNKEKIDNDADLRQFCSYIVFRGSKKLLKSKAKGFIRGQELRRKVLGHKAARVERRTEIKACIKESGKQNKKLCKLTFKLQRQQELKECVDSGKSRRQCRRERRERLRQEHEIM